MKVKDVFLILGVCLMIVGTIVVYQKFFAPTKTPYTWIVPVERIITVPPVKGHVRATTVAQPDTIHGDFPVIAKDSAKVVPQVDTTYCEDFEASVVDTPFTIWMKAIHRPFPSFDYKVGLIGDQIKIRDTVKITEEIPVSWTDSMWFKIPAIIFLLLIGHLL